MIAYIKFILNNIFVSTKLLTLDLFLYLVSDIVTSRRYRKVLMVDRARRNSIIDKTKTLKKNIKRLKLDLETLYAKR